MRLVSVAAAMAIAAPAAAEDRPAEEELFGAPPAAEGTDATPAIERTREEDLFGPSAPAQPALSAEAAPEDPLKIGGQFYLRTEARAQRGVAARKWPLTAPALIDGYFDARPNDRVRGMLLARLSYDPTVDPNAPSLLGLKQDGGPRVALDQLWMRFDILRTVFVTAGKQHVRWGTARIWSPTDYLHAARRDPLAVFDARTGVTMLKLHAPWEQRGWNFYAVGVVDNLAPASTLGRVGGGARAELVFGDAELGLDALAQKGRKPRYGVDLSAGLGPLDVYLGAALKIDGDAPLWRLDAGQYKKRRLVGLVPAVTAGGTWLIQYGDKDLLTLGGEYFYNHAGYDDPKIYPWLLFQGQFTPFYLGKHYAALFAALPGPGNWDNTTFSLTNLANLSDRSFISRLDYSVLILTHLRVEAFGAVHYGKKGGELRLELDVPAQQIGAVSIPHVFVPAPLFEVGAGLRINI